MPNNRSTHLVRVRFCKNSERSAKISHTYIKTTTLSRAVVGKLVIPKVLINIDVIISGGCMIKGLNLMQYSDIISILIKGGFSRRSAVCRD